MSYQPVLTSHVNEPDSFTLDFYLKNLRGYQGLRKALTQKPNDIIEQVKASGLRGRGGAGFPTGMKWQFVLKDTPKPKYIACNADESEPGTFKDQVLMERNPHLLIEGCAIACYAIGAKVAYIYIRGEFLHVQVTAGETGRAVRLQAFDQCARVFGLLALVPVIVDAHHGRAVAGAEAFDLHQRERPGRVRLARLDPQLPAQFLGDALRAQQRA